jgi:predicted DCC family thiol-disulfide oxidoreductase YuxK
VPAPDHLILYDADCGFCTRALDQIMRWDRRGRLRAIAIASPEGQRLLASVPPSERLDSWHLVGPGGELSSAGAAAPRVLRLLRGGALAAALLAAAPGLTDAAYRWVASHRGLLSRFLTLAIALLAVGCGTAAQEGSELSVYLSAPLRGVDRDAGRALAEGATAALEEAGGEAGGVPIRLEVLDDTEPGGSGGGGTGWTQAQVAADARAATEDSTSIGYIGELRSAATRVSVAITNEAGLLQVSPGPVAEALLTEPGGNDVPGEFQPSGERTLVALGAGSGSGPGPNEHGREAMTLILDSIERADDPLSRSSVTAAAFATAERPSALGTYSIDPAGRAAFE